MVSRTAGGLTILISDMQVLAARGTPAHTAANPFRLSGLGFV
jgi:hypothetical protein